MKKTVALIILFLVLMATKAIATDSPSDVVRRFCELDYNGARTQAGDYTPILTLVAYPAEPGWDIVVGIKGYEIKDEHINGDRAELIVEYDIDRSWPSQVKLNKTETFQLIRVGGVWRIEKYILYPRVSVDFICKELRYCQK